MVISLVQSANSYILLKLPLSPKRSGEQMVEDPKWKLD